MLETAEGDKGKHSYKELSVGAREAFMVSTVFQLAFIVGLPVVVSGSVAYLAWGDLKRPWLVSRGDDRRALRGLWSDICIFRGDHGGILLGLARRFGPAGRQWIYGSRAAQVLREAAAWLLCDGFADPCCHIRVLQAIRIAYFTYIGWRRNLYGATRIVLGGQTGVDRAAMLSIRMDP